MAENAHLEATLEQHFRKEVKRRKGVPVKLIAAEKGVPDRLALLYGAVHLVELKQGRSARGRRGRRSAIQRVWHARAAAAGVAVVTLYGRAEVDEWLATLDAQQELIGDVR